MSSSWIFRKGRKRVAVRGESYVARLSREAGSDDVPDGSAEDQGCGPFKHHRGETQTRDCEAADQTIGPNGGQGWV